MNWYIKTVAKIPKANKGGDCYVASGRYVMDNGFENPNILLVHGEVTGQGPIEGVKYGHAWVENGDMVIDNSNRRNIELPKDLYYALGRIDPSKTIKYSAVEVARKSLESGHWGPWQ